MKYEITVQCQPLADYVFLCGSYTQCFDTLATALRDVIKTFGITAEDVKVVDGRWEFIKARTDNPEHRARYTIKVQRIDPVLPSELKRELEKLNG